jgi:hypothetical protein
VSGYKRPSLGRAVRRTLRRLKRDTILWLFRPFVLGALVIGFALGFALARALP